MEGFSADVMEKLSPGVQLCAGLGWGLGTEGQKWQKMSPERQDVREDKEAGLLVF